MEKQTIKLKCPREKCGRIWEYSGKSDWYATCPRCLTKVRVREYKEDEK